MHGDPAPRYFPVKLHSLRVTLALLAATFALSACGGGDNYLRVPDPDEETGGSASSQKEDTITLPSFPAEDRLIRFEVGGVSRNEFYVDSASISVGEDRVIRYAAVIRSPAGARTISYEGLDCSKYAYKVYAFGHADGTWSEVQHPEWKDIKYVEINRYRIVLFNDFFCPKKVPVRTPGEAVRALRSGAHMNAYDSY